MPQLGYMAEPALAPAAAARLDAALLMAALLFLDGMAKVCMTPYAPGFMQAPPLAWMGTAAVQTMAATAVFLGFFSQSIRARHLASCLVFLGVSLVAAPLLAWVHDFSADGQQYHLYRSLMAGAGPTPAGWTSELPVGGVAAIYPLLPDNVRGLLLHFAWFANPYQMVSMNFACLAATVVFWLRHAVFLPWPARLALSISPIAVVQLFTFYIDGFIACICAIAFLVALLSLLELRERAGTGDAAAAALPLWEFLAVTAAVLVQSKYSGASLALLLLLPLALAPCRLDYAAGLGRLLWRRSAPPKALLLVLLLLNPYAFTLLSLAGVDGFPLYAVAHIDELLASLATNLSAHYADWPHWLAFLKSHFFSLLPHGRPSSLAEPAASLQLALDPDARIGGFGVLASVFFWLALGLAIARLALKRFRQAEGDLAFLGRILALTFLAATLLLLFVPYAFWARYIPLYFLFAATLLLLGLLGWGSARGRALALGLYLAWLALPGLLAGAVTLYSVQAMNTAVARYASQLDGGQAAQLKTAVTLEASPAVSAAYGAARSLGRLPAIVTPAEKPGYACTQVRTLTLCTPREPAK